MDTAQLVRLAGEALWLALTLAAPVLAVTFVVSLAGSALASITQVQDGTLVIVPRIVAGLVTLWLVGHWMSARLTQFATELWRAFPGAS